MRPRHYILQGREAVPVDFMTWARMFEDAAQRIVAKTEPMPDTEVSTVFLGLDHNYSTVGPPLLFETAIFAGGECEIIERYATWDEAEAGHAAALERLKGTGHA